MRRVIVVLLLAIACAAAPSEGADAAIGTWRGRAVFRDAPLEFEVRFYRERDSLRATFSSHDLLILDQPLDSVRHVGTHVAFTTRDEHPVHFRGTLAGDTIRGGAGIPGVRGVVAPDPRDDHELRFELHRVADRPSPPYVVRDVRFDGAGVHLVGTTMLPPSPAGARPGVVILQGSSSNVREEFRFYADHFARAGFAVLTFDKRGNGESSGDYGAATYDDLTGDAAAAVEFLRRQPGVDSARVGVWGLSQGAFISPMVAHRVPSLKFIVAVSPPGGPTGESAAYQDSMRLVAAGFPADTARRAAALNRTILAWLQRGGSPADVDAELARVADTRWRRTSSLPRQLPDGPALGGWYWRGRALDPAPAWRALRVPVLVIFGAADDLVPAQLSGAQIRRALREGGNRDVTVQYFPAANHVLRVLPLVAGGKWDWPKGAPGYLDGLTSWMLERTR